MYRMALFPRFFPRRWETVVLMTNAYQIIRMIVEHEVKLVRWQCSDKMPIQTCEKNVQ